MPPEPSSGHKPSQTQGGSFGSWVASFRFDINFDLRAGLCQSLATTIQFNAPVLSIFCFLPNLLFFTPTNLASPCKLLVAFPFPLNHCCSSLGCELSS